MKERPIIFSGPMVRAILDGKKTQTRRVVAEQRGWDPQKLDLRVVAEHPDIAHTQAFFGEGWGAPCPYGKRGDRLWVRETWGRDVSPDGDARLYYPSDGEWRSAIFHATRPDLLEKMGTTPVIQVSTESAPPKGRSSIFMPRWVSRLTLEVTGIRVERLNDISEADAQAEGLSRNSKDGGQTWKWGLADRDGLPGTDDDGLPWSEWSTDARKPFAALWDRINGEWAPWASNPWVWVVEFKEAA